MKTLILSLLTLIATQSAFATVGGIDDVWIVVNDEYTEEMYLKEVPLDGCWGVPQGPRLIQFTSEYSVKSSMGCGVAGDYRVDLNALSCATIEESVESEDFMSFDKIRLNISECSLKDNARFITLVRTAAARNFPQSENGEYVSDQEVELVLIK